MSEMITSAITAAVGAVLAYFGVKPGLYLGVVWVVTKILVVGSIAGLMWWRQKAAQRKVDAAAAAPPVEQETK